MSHEIFKSIWFSHVLLLNTQTLSKELEDNKGKGTPYFTGQDMIPFVEIGQLKLPK